MYTHQVARSLFRSIAARALDHVPGIIRRGPRRGRVALSFDDGPTTLTARTLEVLDDLGAPATFFLTGKAVEAEPGVITSYLRRGHQIGSHGFDHTRFPALSRRDLLTQLARTDRALGGHSFGRAWVRPPHGALDVRSTVTLLSAGYRIALWSIDSHDHRERDPSEIVRRLGSARVEAGDVILLHEGQPWTLEALPGIVRSLTDAGLELVTMHDLVES